MRAGGAAAHVGKAYRFREFTVMVSERLRVTARREALTRISRLAAR